MANTEDLLDQIEMLTQKNETLLKELGTAAALPRVIERLFTPQEQTLLRVLAARDRVSYASLNIAIMPAGRWEPADVKLVHVLASRMRKRLTPLNINIETFHGFGYGLTPASKKRLAEMKEMEDEGHEPKAAVRKVQAKHARDPSKRGAASRPSDGRWRAQVRADELAEGPGHSQHVL